MGILFYFFLGLYGIVMLLFLKGWLSTPNINSKLDKQSSLSATVVVPFRNEREHITELISNLKNQSYAPGLTTFMLVDDASDDESFELARIASVGDARFCLIKAEGEGKKMALLKAYRQISSDIIVSLDADCTVGTDWLTSIVSCFNTSDAKLVIGPIKLSPVQSLWEKWQAIEFQSLAVTAAGSSGINAPVLSFGANLAFSSVLLADIDKALNLKTKSGDDMFLLEYTKKHYSKSVKFLKDKRAMVSTSPVALNGFFKQRKRWASKSNLFTDWQIIVVGVIVVLTSLLLTLGFIGVFFDFRALFLPLIGLFTGKLIVDFTILLSSSSFFGTKKYLYLMPLIALVYPFYVLYSTLVGIAFKNKVVWKGRS